MLSPRLCYKFVTLGKTLKRVYENKAKDQLVVLLKGTDFL